MVWNRFTCPRSSRPPSRRRHGLVAAAAWLALSAALVGCAVDGPRGVPALWQVESESGKPFWIVSSTDDLPLNQRPSALNYRSIDQALPEAAPPTRRAVSERLRDKPPPRTWYHGQLKNALQASDEVLIERGIEIAAGTLTDLAYGMSGQCGGVEAHLDPPMTARYMALFDEVEPPYAGAPRSLAGAAFAVAILATSRKQWSIEVGVDDWYFAQAAGEGLQRTRLITMRQRREAFQRAFDSADCQAQVQALRTAMAWHDSPGEPAQGPVAYDIVVRDWLNGDLAAFQRDLAQRVDRSPLLYQALISESNPDWAQSIADRVRRGRPGLAVVGTARLVGPGNIIQLLEIIGFNARRIQ